MSRRVVMRVPTILTILIAGASVIWAGHICAMYFLGQADVPVSYIDIEGSLDAGQEAMVQKKLSAMSMSDLDITRVKSELEGLSWVDEVGVRRVWPDGLRVAITRLRAVARWGDEGYLDAEGKIFTSERRTEGMARLPALEGPQGSERLVMGQYRQLSKSIQKSGQAIDSLILRERGEWILGLRNKVIVRLGKDNIADRVQRLMHVLDEARLTEKLHDIAELDARYPNGIAVKWKEEACTEDCYELAENDNFQRVQTL